MEKNAQVDQVFGVKWNPPVDKYNNPVEGDFTPEFTTDNAEVATIEPDTANGPYAAIVHTQSKVDSTIVRIKVKTSSGEDLIGPLAVHVTAGNAVSFGEPAVSDATEDPDAD